MIIDDKLLQHLSNLSKLDFPPQEKEEIRKDLEKMIGFFEKLQELPTEGIEPLIFMNDRINALRKDEIKNGLPTEEALQNAPDRKDQFFRVPKVVKNKEE